MLSIARTFYVKWIRPKCSFAFHRKDSADETVTFVVAGYRQICRKTDIQFKRQSDQQEVSIVHDKLIEANRQNVGHVYGKTYIQLVNSNSCLYV